MLETPEIVKICQIKNECRQESTLAIRDSEQPYANIYSCENCAIELRDRLLEKYPIEKAKRLNKAND